MAAAEKQYPPAFFLLRGGYYVPQLLGLNMCAHLARRTQTIHRPLLSLQRPRAAFRVSRTTRVEMLFSKEATFYGKHGISRDDGNRTFAATPEISKDSQDFQTSESSTGALKCLEILGNVQGDHEVTIFVVARNFSFSVERSFFWREPKKAPAPSA